MRARDSLGSGLAALGLALPADALEKLLAFTALLGKWNRVYNLTAVRDASRMVSHHLLDSLSVLPHLGHAVRLADVGSGAGLPGIPLAIARPALQVSLVDSSQKKSAFQQQAKIELGLGNVSVHCTRVEQWRPAEKFDAVISRAFSDLGGFIRSSGHLLAEDGALLAMKGAPSEAEIAALPQGWRVAEVMPLRVPGVGGARHLLRLTRE